MNKTNKAQRGRTWPLNVAMVLASVAMALPAIHARAQQLPPTVKPGMSLAELQATGIDLQRVQRPERMPNGTRGLWQSLQSGDDGLSFEATYFLRGTTVDRIDLVLVSAPDGNAAAFERIVGKLRGQFGPELRSQQSSGAATDETASWSDDDQNIAAYSRGERGAEKIRVVYKRREVRNGDTL